MKRPVEKMRGGVVGFDRAAAGGIEGMRNDVSDLEIGIGWNDCGAMGLMRYWNSQATGQRYDGLSPHGFA